MTLYHPTFKDLQRELRLGGMFHVHLEGPLAYCSYPMDFVLLTQPYETLDDLSRVPCSSTVLAFGLIHGSRS